MPASDEFEQIQTDPDPVRRARRASDLISEYQRLAIELAKLRRNAIEEAHDTGLSYTDIATMLGITKSRISQIRAWTPDD